MLYYKSTPTLIQRNRWYQEHFFKVFDYDRANAREYALHLLNYSELYVLIMLGTEDQEDRVYRYLTELQKEIRRKCNATCAS